MKKLIVLVALAACLLWPARSQAMYVDGMSTYPIESSNPLNRLDPTGLYDTDGHYYTVYAVAVAAGMNPLAAQRLAYFSQYPDQDPVYDAVAVGKAWARDTLTGGLTPAARKRMEDIQNLLHALHGGNPDAVDARRKCLKKLLQDGGLSNIEKGLVAHALGDAYGHVRGSEGGEFAFPVGEGHALAGHQPDRIALHPERYQAYVNALFDALGGNRDNPTQMAMLTAIINNSGNLPEDLTKAATAMDKFVRMSPFGLASTYKPNPGEYDPVWVRPTAGQVDRLMDKIKDSCKCQ